MKPIDRHNIIHLEDLPNVGKSIAADLRLIDIRTPDQLTGQDAYEMYEKLCSQSGRRQDPCVLDVFLSIISYMEGEPAMPWWVFTPERKKRLASNQ